MIQLYRFPMSTNVERVALALAHKGLQVESIDVDPRDRTPVRAISGQDLVPVIRDNGKVVVDSMEILNYLEETYPDPPLYPEQLHRRAEMEVFIDWFNRVWKRPPNEITVELEKPQPDAGRVKRLGAAMTGYLDLFEKLLAGRDYLMGERLSAADCAAWPFVSYALIQPQKDPYLFHQVLMDHQPLGDQHPGLKAWIRRVEKHPRV